MEKSLTKKSILVLSVLCLLAYLYSKHLSRTVSERQSIGHALMLDRKGNMSWVLDLVRRMDPENPARKVLLSNLKNYGVNKAFLQALQSEITPQQRKILK